MSERKLWPSPDEPICTCVAQDCKVHFKDQDMKRLAKAGVHPPFGPAQCVRLLDEVERFQRAVMAVKSLQHAADCWPCESCKVIKWVAAILESKP